MAGVIDLTDDPRIDMAMAQSIGNILKSVGQAEQNRQKRYKIDQVMSGINSGVDPMQAIQDANNAEAPRSGGLAGVGQGFGRLIGGAPRNLDVTDDAIEKLLMGNLNQSIKLKDPQYQANVAGTKARTAGTLQNIDQSAGMYPIQKEGANLRNIGTQQNIDQSAGMYPLQKEGANLRNIGTQQNIDQSAGMYPLQKEGANLRNIGTQQNIDQSAGMYPLQKEGAELSNQYKQKQIDAPRSGTGAKAVDKDSEYFAIKKIVGGYEGAIPPEDLRILTARADRVGYGIKEKDVTVYRSNVQEDEGGKFNWLGEGKDRSKNYIPPKIGYEVVPKSDAVPSRESLGLPEGTKSEQASSAPSGGEVTLQDDKGQVIGTYPDLPDRTYVESNGKTYTISNDQLNDFKETYPEASVYQTFEPTTVPANFESGNALEQDDLMQATRSRPGTRLPFDEGYTAPEQGEESPSSSGDKAPRIIPDNVDTGIFKVRGDLKKTAMTGLQLDRIGGSPGSLEGVNEAAQKIYKAINKVTNRSSAIGSGWSLDRIKDVLYEQVYQEQKSARETAESDNWRRRRTVGR